jgi:hypothetical protein
MTVRFSTAARNHAAQFGGYAGAFAGGALEIYTGAQPASADAAVTGTMLCRYSVSSGALTKEVRAVGSLTISGASGSVNTVTVNSLDILGTAVPFTTDLTTTAALVAKEINRNPRNKLFRATSSVAVVTITAIQGLGTLPNTWAVNGTATTLTLGTLVNMAGGVNQVNGLMFNPVTNAVMSKSDAQVWSGTAAATGTAGWGRLVGPLTDAGATDSSEALCRMDFSIATSGADLNMASTSFTASAPNTIDTFSLTVPASV